VPKLRAIGLCHEFLGMRGRVIQMWRDEVGSLQRENFETEFDMVTAGLNHFAFVQKLVRRATGEDLLPELPARMHPMFGESQPLNMYLLDHYGQAAYTEDSHSGEYIPWARHISNIYGYNWDENQRSDAKQREEILKNLESGPNFFWWLERSGERVAEIIKGILDDTGYVEGAVNIPNAEGLLPFLPGNIAVEVPAVIDAQGLHGQEITTLPKGIQGLLRHEAVVSDLGIEAALTGDKDVALQALLADGTCPTPEIAENILNTMLEKQRKYLPQFFP
jgi:alpha-galactosidase